MLAPLILHFYRRCALLNRFLFDHNLDVRSHVFVEAYRYVELAQRFQRLMQLDLPAINMEALLLKSLGNVA